MPIFPPPAPPSLVTVDGVPQGALAIDSTPISAADVSADPAGSAAAVASGLAPGDHGYLTWTYDPILSSGASNVPAGSIVLAKVKVWDEATVASIALSVSAAGVTLANSFVALFGPTGTRLGVSTDQSSTGTGSSNWTTTGVKTIALTAPASVDAGTYFLGILIGSGGTIPTFLRGASSAAVNAGLSAPSLRFSTVGTGLTAMPSSVDLSTQSAAQPALWAALRA